jgi:hypothetical protein
MGRTHGSGKRQQEAVRQNEGAQGEGEVRPRPKSAPSRNFWGASHRRGRGRADGEAPTRI